MLGAHLFTSDGYSKTFEMAKDLGCQAIQIFTKNQRQWKAKSIGDKEIKEFENGRQKADVKIVMAHGSYILNVASPKKPLWHMSVNSLAHEVERCSILSIPLFVLHPGSAGESDRNQGIKSVISGLNAVIDKTPNCSVRILLETAAGQGNTIGNRFEELAEILAGVNNKERVGVCFDTCHVFAAGYDITSKERFDATRAEFDRIVGLSNLFALHLNDSKKQLGSRVDRHEHIGKGQIGKDAFAFVLNDQRLASLPMVIETPKEGDMDVMNLEILRGLIKK